MSLTTDREVINMAKHQQAIGAGLIGVYHPDSEEQYDCEYLWALTHVPALILHPGIDKCLILFWDSYIQDYETRYVMWDTLVGVPEGLHLQATKLPGLGLLAKPTQTREEIYETFYAWGGK